MATHWYCGSCKYGPYLVSLYSVCRCEHQRCPCCPTETIDTRDTTSSLGDVQSERSDCPGYLAAALHSTYPAPQYAMLPNSTSFSSPLTAHATGGSKIPANTFLTTIGNSIPHMFADLTSHDVRYTILIPTHNYNRERPSGGGKVESYWQCCYCRGSWNSHHNTHCTEYHCNHQKCDYCPVSYVKKH
jgi:hypothetical protein